MAETSKSKEPSKSEQSKSEDKRMQRMDKEVPARQEKNREGAESKLTSAHSHGTAENGGNAPDQYDQAIINKEKRDAIADGDNISDPRWQPSQNMRVIEPDQKERAEELNKLVMKDMDEANAKSSAANPTMGGEPRSTTAEDKKTRR